MTCITRGTANTPFSVCRRLFVLFFPHIAAVSRICPMFFHDLLGAESCLEARICNAGIVEGTTVDVRVA